MLILAHRPFPRLDPYAETGPIFLCADPCERHPESEPPAYLRFDALMKAYLENDRIHYGTGEVIPPEAVTAKAAALLQDPANAYVHVRSGRNNCYQFRVDRG